MLTPWCSGGPSLFSFNQDIKPVLFLAGVQADIGSLGEDEDIPDSVSASPPFDFLLQAFAAWIKRRLSNVCFYDSSHTITMFKTSLPLPLKS